MNTDALISVVLDQSGSMSSIKSAMIKGYNKFKAEQLAVPGKTLWSLTLFETGNIEQRYTAVDAKSVPDLDDHSFRPGGGTPLYDAIANAITATRNISKASLPDKVIFLIITDGGENASTEYTGIDGLEKLRKLVEDAQTFDDWQFVFLGADMTAWSATASSMGFAATSSAGFTASAGGTNAMYASTSTSTTNYRTGATRSVMVDTTTDPLVVTSASASGIPNIDTSTNAGSVAPKTRSAKKSNA